MSVVIPVFDIALISVAVVLLFFVHEIALVLKGLLVNTVSGFAVLATCHLIGLGVVLTPLTVFEIAIGGVPAAIITVLFGYLGITLYAI